MAFENKQTHPAITKHAVDRSVLAEGYLNEQLGLSSDLNTMLELTDDFRDRIQMRVLQEPNFSWDKSSLSIREWLMEGSSLEDVPNPRARHHFHDPIRDHGLDNSDGPAWLMNLLYFGSQHSYPKYHAFTAMGISDLDIARGTHFWSEPAPVYRNWCDWPRARDLFYDALTVSSESDRQKTLGSMFVTLGHICHLLEDMGVPAHTRNDFIWGHLVAGFHKKITGAKNPWYKGGHPFEAWLEEQIVNDGNEIPSVYLNRLMDSTPVFSKLEHYWDTNICEPSGVAQWQGDSPGWPGTSFGNPPPEKAWGLVECTNYQFLSYSTIFKSGDLQSFPHPAKEHTRVDWYLTGPDGAKQYYRIGYDIPHLARSTYSAYLLGDIAFWNTDTTEEKRVYENYAKRTIPRTIDYTTGLLNYFFRGRLSVEAECVECDVFEITITNKSSNSGTPQTLKGGDFELYWEDGTGNRAEVPDFGIDGGWTSSSTLAYDEDITAAFTKPMAGEPVKYILVYRGNICENPAAPDPDDEIAIAVAVFTPPSDDCCVKGACCDYETENCSITTEEDCPYTWLGENTVCDDCREPLEHIYITFDGMANCDCLYCDHGWGIWESWVFESYAECVNGTHLLTLDSDNYWTAYYDCGDFFDSAILWWTAIGGEPCSKNVPADGCQLFKIYVKRIEAEVIVGVQCNYMDYFHGRFLVDGNSIAGQCSNTLSCGSNDCDTIPNWYIPTESGTATVWY
jgi:hypothetical protein